VGIFQGLVIRRYREHRARRWILVAIVAWPLCVVAGIVAGIAWNSLFGTAFSSATLPGPVTPLHPFANNLVGLLVSVLLLSPGGGVGGVLYGYLQWPSIRTDRAGQKSWLIAHAIAGLAIGYIFFGFVNAFNDHAIMQMLTFSAAGAAVYGAVTGIPLSWTVEARGNGS
jgi:hypothetical protein